MSSESTINTRCYKIAQRLTALGIAIVPTYPGEHRAKFLDWQNQATVRMSTVDTWMNTGYPLPDAPHVVTPDHNWVCVAKRDGAGCLDIDNLAKCLAMGMPALPEGIFTVDTPGGGLHVPFVHTPETAALNNKHDVYEKDDKENGELVFEFKGHNTPWCGPWQERAKNPGVMYKPRDRNAPLMVGVPADLLAWIKVHSEEPSANHTPEAWNWDEDFDIDDFVTHHGASLNGQDFYDAGGSFFAVVEECPICGTGAGGSTARAAKCKFIFGGRGRGGYKCQACGISSLEELETALQEEDPDWEPWDEPIYARTEEDPDWVNRLDEDEEPAVPTAFTTLFPAATEVQPPAELKYSQLRFPYEAFPAGLFKNLVDDACTGGLDPGLVVPALMALASAIPATDEMDEERINIMVNLLALPGAGKDMAIKRVLAVLGLAARGKTTEKLRAVSKCAAWGR